jgi:hypothetical protein
VSDVVRDRSQAIFPLFFQKFHHARSLRQLLPKGCLSKVHSKHEHLLGQNALDISFARSGRILFHDFCCSLKVFDDIAVEITMAILQFLNSKPSEEYLFRTLKALSKFVFVS